MNPKVKILIADDHPVFRHGLCMIIQNEANLTFLGEAENGKIALELVEQNKPDVVILDLDMPVMDGVETARNLYKKFPEVKTVILTMHKNRDLLNMMKSLNIKGYMLKDSAIIEIVDCIKKVVDGNTFISPAITEMLLEEISFVKNQLDFEEMLSNLTSAEKRIIKLIAETKSTREIAEELFISVRTVENHRFNICNKLNLKGNHSLIRFAISNKNIISSFNK